MKASYYIRELLLKNTPREAREYLGIFDETDEETPTPPGGGNVIGPAGSTAGHIATYADGTGTLLADSGVPATLVPSTGEKAALVGTSGAPGAGNLYVTNADARNTNARTPTAHAASHQNGGSDEISVAGLSGLLADQQTPLAHASSHSDGGSDAVDILDLDGYTGSSSDVLRGDATWGAGGGGSDWDVTIIKSADQTVSNNATPQNDTELFTTLSANTLYLIEVVLLYSGNNTTGDYRCNLTFPATSGGAAPGFYSGYNASLTGQIATGAGVSSITQWPSNAGDLILGTTANPAELITALIRVTLHVGGSGGTLQFKFANSAAALGRDSITKAGATLRVKAFIP